ncbi:hypothetical protein [Pseudomonas sp. 2FE]|uniref:hypothetical protein n=1 Tax=Pseudomonas sp. 2FE TaxID=2502190 RepID=UPI0010F9C2D5|nr:hypothetical protein [Pseudomonas sp. 2FE]
MNAQQAVEAIQAEVQKAKAQGNQIITVESLESYLGSLAQHIVTQAPLEQAGLDFQKQAHEHRHQSEQALFRTVIDSGQVALKSSLLIGGGAAAALLAFASSAWKSLKPEGLEFLGLGVLLLAISVLCVGVAAGFTYLSQSFYHDGMGKSDDCREDKIGDGFLYATLGLVIVSYLLYGVACWYVYRMMQSFSVIAPFPVG